MATAINIISTIHNLNATGTITPTSSLLNTAIVNTGTPVGLYQLINQIISDLSSLKSTIKAREKVLISALATETTTTSTADHTPIANLESVNNQTRGKTGALLVDAGSGTSTKPSILSTTGGATREYSEDAVFELLQRLSHELMCLRNGQNVSQGSTGPGDTAIPVSIKATD